MLNGASDLESGQNCWNTVNEILNAAGISTETCAQYYLSYSGARPGFDFKFIKCPAGSFQ